MTKLTQAGLILALALSGAAAAAGAGAASDAAMANSDSPYWQEVWQKSEDADTPKKLNKYLRGDKGDDEVINYMATEQLYRLTAGQPVDPLKRATKRYGVKRWTGQKSTCTPEDQRQYRRWEVGSIHYVSGFNFAYATFHRVRDKDWDPCAKKQAPWQTRMEPHTKITYTPLAR